MKVKCIINRGKDLPEELLPNRATISTEFNLMLGNSYSVYAISCWRYIFSYLIATPDDPRPSWYPAELFEIIDPTLPDSWYFKFYRQYTDPRKKSLIALWGYRELIEDDNHYVMLLELEPDALEVFYQRRREIDAQNNHSID